MATHIQKIRSRSFAAQNGKCHYCEVPMWESNSQAFANQYRLSRKQALRLKCTAEHLTACRDGGTTTRPNIVAACVHCNGRRHKSPAPMLPEVYKSYVRKQVIRGKWHSFPIPSSMYEEHR